MIEMILALPDNVIGIVAKGEVTKEDYEQTLIPAVEEALATHDKVDLADEADASAWITS